MKQPTSSSINILWSNTIETDAVVWWTKHSLSPYLHIFTAKESIMKRTLLTVFLFSKAPSPLTHSIPTSKYKSRVQDIQRSLNGLNNTVIESQATYYEEQQTKSKPNCVTWEQHFQMFFLMLPIMGNIIVLILLSLVAIDAVPQCCSNRQPS